MSGVGISFGAERIFDIMEEQSLFPEDELQKTKAIILAMDIDSHRYGFAIVSKLRAKGFAVDIYPEVSKFKKQIKHAHQGGYPYVIIIGEEERISEQLTLKNMLSGEQQLLSVSELAKLWA